MKNKITYLLPLMLLLFSQILYAQDDNYDDLFGDTDSGTTESESGSDSSSAGGEYDDLFNDTGSDSGSEDTSASLDAFSMGPEFKLSFLGEHTFEFHAPVVPDHLNFIGAAKSPKFKNDLGIEIAYKKLNFVSHWELDLILNEAGNLEQFLRVIPLENYIQWSPKIFKFAVGFQEFSWGTGDGINPTDNLNPVDITQGADTEKLSVLSAYAAVYPIDLLSLEFVYIPFAQQNNLGTKVTDTITEQLGVTPTITGDDFDPSSFVLGSKLSFYSRFVDLSFSYIYNIDRYYSPDLAVTSKLGGIYYSMNELELYRRRVHNFGADFRTMVDRFTIWGEICFTMTEDYLLNRPDIRNHTLDWVVGFDFNYGPNSDFYFNLQYLGQFVPLYDANFSQEYVDEWNPAFRQSLNFNLNEDPDYYEEYSYRTLTNTLAGVSNGLYQGLLLNMEWPVNNDLVTPQIRLGYFIPLLYDTNNEKKYGSLMINPEVEIKPFDSFNIIMGARLNFAWHETKGRSVATNYSDQVGRSFDDSNIYLEVVYKWSVDIEK